LNAGSETSPEKGAGAPAGRSARAQKRFVRRVDELERNRHVGVLIAWHRRYDEIRGYELAAAIGVALFTTVLPLILIGFAWAESFKSNRSSADLVIRQFNLHSETARVVRDTFSSASSERGSSRRGCCSTVTSAAGALVPTAVAGTVLTVVVVLLGHVVVPYRLSQWTQSLGGIGVAFITFIMFITFITFITFIVLVAVSRVMVATFGAVYRERTADPELVAADQLSE
jgi:hypothetical protein